jgi:hypothetical protein
MYVSVVGNSPGTNRAKYSFNGYEWFDSSSGTPDLNYEVVIYAGGTWQRFVAIASGLDSIMTSTDGMTWTQII